jgi:hypothetical protein
VVSGDTYCEKARYIPATEAQRNEFAARWEFWESFVRPVAANNKMYSETCAQPVSDPRGKSK